MKQYGQYVSRFVLATGAAWALSSAAAAQSLVPVAPEAMPAAWMAPDAPPPCGGPQAPQGRHARPMGEPDGIPGLALDETQRDKVFAIRHAVAPEMRRVMREARAARRALHELVASGNFDESKGLELAKREAAALSQATLLRAHTEHQVLAVLTPQQRQQLAQQPAPRHGDGPHRAGPRGPQRGEAPMPAAPGKS